MKRDVPLQIITGATKDLIVLGTLESEERSILDSAMYQGLGVGLDHTLREETPQQIQVKKEYSSITPSSANPTTSVDPNAPAEYPVPTTSSGTVNTQVPNRDTQVLNRNKLHSPRPSLNFHSLNYRKVYGSLLTKYMFRRKRE